MGQLTCVTILHRYGATSIVALTCSLPSPAAPTCLLIALSQHSHTFAILTCMSLNFQARLHGSAHDDNNVV
jgi:hypothetical protein